MSRPKPIDYCHDDSGRAVTPFVVLRADADRARLRGWRAGGYHGSRRPKPLIRCDVTHVVPREVCAGEYEIAVETPEDILHVRVSREASDVYFCGRTYRLRWTGRF